MNTFIKNNTLIASKSNSWNPAILNGLTLWLDANNSSSITTNGLGDVTLWSDLSSNNNDAAVDLAAPTIDPIGLNNRPAVVFNRLASQCLVINNTINLSDKHFVSMVYRHISGGNARYICKWNSTGSASWMFSGISTPSQTTRYIISTNGTNSSVSSIATYYTNPTIAVGQQLGTGTNSLGLYINGTISPTLGSPTAGPFVTNTKTTLGRLNQSSVDFTSFAVSEIVIFSNNSLTATNREKLEGYLAHKWGLTSNLPSNHPYKNNKPTK